MKSKKPSPPPQTESEPQPKVVVSRVLSGTITVPVMEKKIVMESLPSPILEALEQEIRAMDNGLFGPVAKPDCDESAEETLARCLAMMRHIKQRGIETGVLRF